MFQNKLILYGIVALSVVIAVVYFISTLKTSAVNEYKAETTAKVVEEVKEDNKKQAEITIEWSKKKNEQSTKVDKAIQEARKSIPKEIPNETSSTNPVNPDADWMLKFNAAVREANRYSDNP